MKRRALSGRSAVSLLCTAALVVSCEASRTLHLLDGESQNFGGDSGEMTSSGGVSEELPGSGGGTGGGASVTVIDDFADCNGLITETAGRSGSWYHFVDPPKDPVRLSYGYGFPPDDTWGTQKCGYYLSGECPTCIAAGVGFELAPDGYDLSGYSGIRVSFESETSLWSVIVTLDGYSEYVELLPTGGMSAERILSFEDIYPGNGFQGLAVAREVQFTVGEGDRGSFAFGIHRVELVE